MIRLLVMKGADGANKVVVLANGSIVAVPSTVAAAGGSVSKLSDLEFLFP